MALGVDSQITGGDRMSKEQSLPPNPTSHEQLPLTQCLDKLCYTKKKNIKRTF